MIDAFIAFIRFAHPDPWTPLEAWLTVLGVVVFTWVAIDWIVETVFRRTRRAIRRYRVRRVLRERGACYDPSLSMERRNRPAPLDRSPLRATDLPTAAPRGLDGPGNSSGAAGDVQQPPCCALEPASTLVDSRVAGYGTGTILEALPEDRLMFMERLR